MTEEIKAILTKKKKQMNFPTDISRIIKLDKSDGHNVIELVREDIKN